MRWCKFTQLYIDGKIAKLCNPYFSKIEVLAYNWFEGHYEYAFRPNTKTHKPFFFLQKFKFCSNKII